MARMRQTTSGAILDVARAGGVPVETATAITGKHVAPVAAELIQRGGCHEFVHEALSVGASVGLARSTGRPQLAVVTGGPGATNAITPMATARSVRAGVVLLIGETHTAVTDRVHIQSGHSRDLSYESMYRGIGPVWRAETPRQAVVFMALAVRHAAVNRAPAVIIVPFSVQREPSPGLDVMATHEGADATDRDVGDFLAQRIAQADRPVVIAGRGAESAALQIERLGCPVLWSPECRHRGLTIGLGAQPGAVAVLDQATDVFVFGADLHDIEAPQDGAAVFHWATTPERAGMTWTSERVSIQDAAGIRAAVEHALERMPARQPWATLEHQRTEPAGDRTELDPGTAMAWISEAIRDHDESVVACADIGGHTGFALRALQLRPGDQWLVDIEHAAMGSGLGMALGAALAVKGAGIGRVVAIVGDGGLEMYMGALIDITSKGLPLSLVVIDNGGWAMVSDGMRVLYPDLDQKGTFRSRGHVALEKVCGAYMETHVIRSREDFAAMTDWLTGPPCCVVVKVTDETLVAERLAGMEWRHC